MKLLLIRSRNLLLATVLSVAIMPSGYAQDAAPIVLPGPWGEMLEESPASPLIDAGDAAIRLRRQHMRAVSSQYRSIETLSNAGTPLAPMSEAAARTLDELARRNADLFAPEVLRDTPYGAKAAIWQEPVEFAEHVEAFAVATGRLLQAIEAHAAERVPTELAAVRYQCLACHYHYAIWENRPGVEGRRAAPKP